MKYQLLVLLVLFLFAIKKTRAQGLCSGTDVTTCFDNNPALNKTVPLFHGRCCLKEGSCLYKEKLTPGIIENESLTCGTGVEICTNVPEVGQNVFSDCYGIQVELPYKCCYIGYRYSRKCMPLNVSNKNIYGIFEAQFKAIYGLSSEYKLKIECGSSFISSLYSLILALSLIILF